jgi:hypothetical protein
MTRGAGKSGDGSKRASAGGRDAAVKAKYHHPSPTGITVGMVAQRPIDFWSNRPVLVA